MQFINEILYLIWNWVCFLYLQHITIQNSHISGAFISYMSLVASVLDSPPQWKFSCVIIFKKIYFIYDKIHSFKGYNSVFFNIVTKLCKNHHYLTSEHFHRYKKKPCTHSYLLSPAPAKPLATTNLLFFSINFPFWTFHINKI